MPTGHRYGSIDLLLPFESRHYSISIYFSFVVFLFLIPEVGIHSVLSHMDLCNFSRGKEMMKCDKFLKNPSIPLKDAIHVSLELIEAHLKGVYILWRLYFGTNQESWDRMASRMYYIGITVVYWYYKLVLRSAKKCVASTIVLQEVAWTTINTINAAIFFILHHAFKFCCNTC